MNDAAETAYYLRRERAARALAAKAADPHIARIHLDLADKYAQAALGAADVLKRRAAAERKPRSGEWEAGQS